MSRSTEINTAGQGLHRVPRPHVWRDVFKLRELLAGFREAVFERQVAIQLASVPYMGSGTASNAEELGIELARELTCHRQRLPAVRGAVVGDADRVERAGPGRVGHGRHGYGAWSVLQDLPDVAAHQGSLQSAPPRPADHEQVAGVGAPP